MTVRLLEVYIFHTQPRLMLWQLTAAQVTFTSRQRARRGQCSVRVLGQGHQILGFCVLLKQSQSECCHCN